MKKIGIITIVKVNNYGAELQAFALYKKLELLGYDSEIIDYLFYKNPNHKKEKCSRPFYNFPIKNRIKEWILPKLEYVKSFRNFRAYKNREKGFKNFHDKNTKFSKICYNSYSKLYKNPPIYDVYCVGSDQVWNPNCYTNISPYFLTFAPKEKKRISYASSFGVKNLPDNLKSKYRELLQKIQCISVREKAGVEIIENITGKRVTNVADPTLLLTKEEWYHIAKFDKVPKEKYILLYVLKDSDYIKQKAIFIRNITGYKIVRICKGAYTQDKASDNILNITDAAPDDFLGLIHNAEIVLTNSFHGTVFSILFEKDFYTIIKSGVENNTRQISLLNTLKIDRIRYENENFVLADNLNWEYINNNLNSFRQKSIDYLIKAIDEK